MFIEMDDYLIVSPYNKNSSVHNRMSTAVYVFLWGTILFNQNINKDRAINKVFR